MTQVSDPAPNPHATAEEVQAAYHDPKLANVLYHDWEAGTYDEKWSISYDERCISYATEVFNAVAGTQDQPYGHAMELGSGTGFFLLNLMQGGVIKKGSVTDLSPGMVRSRCATRRTSDSTWTAVADAERHPVRRQQFRLVVGHAVLHHIPDAGRVPRGAAGARPAVGSLAGEPTKIGDFYARRLGRLTWWLTTNIRSCHRCVTGVVRSGSSTSRLGRRRWRRWWSTCTRSIPPN